MVERVVVVAGVVVSPLGVVVAVIAIIWRSGEGHCGGLCCIGGSVIIVGGAVWWSSTAFGGGRVVVVVSVD